MWLEEAHSQSGEESDAFRLSESVWREFLLLLDCRWCWPRLSFWWSVLQILISSTWSPKCLSCEGLRRAIWSQSSDIEPVLRQRETYKHGAPPQRHRSHSACCNHRFSHLLLPGDCWDCFWLQRFDAVLIESWSVCQSLSTWHKIMQWADRSPHGCKEYVQLVRAVFVFAFAKLNQKIPETI